MVDAGTSSTPSPGPTHVVLRDAGSRRPDGPDQLPPDEHLDAVLDRALGETGSAREGLKARGDPGHLPSAAPPPEKEIDQERGRLLLATDQFLHQRIQDVGVHPDPIHGPMVISTIVIKSKAKSDVSGAGCWAVCGVLGAGRD